MQKMNYIPQIVFPILKFNKILQSDWWKAFWPITREEDIQFLQNYIANYGASFKAQKVMPPSLKCQIFCFWSKFASFTQLSRQQTQFSKLSPCHFLLYLAKYLHAKNLKNSPSRSWGKCIKDRRADRQKDRWTGLIL